jgi:hypothetical protein
MLLLIVVMSCSSTIHTGGSKICRLHGADVDVGRWRTCAVLVQTTMLRKSVLYLNNVGKLS